MTISLIGISGLIILGIVLGGIFAWFMAKFKFKSDSGISSSELEKKYIAKEIFLRSEKDISELKKEMNGRNAKIEELTQINAQRQQKIEDLVQRLNEQRKEVEELHKQLTTEFENIANRIMQNQSKQFVNTNEEKISGILAPIKDALGRYEQQISSLEKRRAADYGGLDAQIKALLEAHRESQKVTGDLVTALRKPQVKGSWGQSTLKRVVELSGMAEYVDFNEEVSVNTQDGRQRPDMIVDLPSDRQIVIDSKVSTEAYFNAIEARTEEDRKTHLLKHAQQVRKHMKELSSKSYWSQFQKAPDFVVMFIPGESFYSAAVSVDSNLMEEGWENNVIIATPNNLIGLLKTIAYGWRQEQMNKNALEVAALGQEMYERLAVFVGNFQKVGNSIFRAVEAYNASTGSLESRVLVTARKFKELGVAAKSDIEEVAQIDKIPRIVTSESNSLENKELNESTK